MAGLTDIDGTTETKLLLAVAIDVYDADADTTTTLYWSEADVTTDAIDGTMREWAGRIDGWDTFHRDQKIGGSRYAHPTCTINVRLGMPEGDEVDDLWDHLTDDHVWEEQEATVYLVDLTQEDGDGAREELTKAKVRAAPSKLRPGGSFSLTVVGGMWRTKVPNVQMAMPSERRTEFLQPVLWTTNTATLDGAVNDTATAWVLNNATQVKAGHVAMVCDIGTGASDELVYVEASDGVTDITVIRGYNGTTPVAHADLDYFYSMIPGPSQEGQNDGTSGSVLPFVMGTGTEDRGIHDVSDYVIARTHRTVGVGHRMTAYVSGADGPKVEKIWTETGGTINVDEEPDTWNDLNDAYAGTVIGWGDDPGAANEAVHLEPNPILAGSYVDSGAAISAYKGNQYQVWVRLRGLTQNGNEAGTRLQTVADFAYWLLDNANFGYAVTPGDYIADSQIDGFLSGGWHDEYAENWWTETACVVPQYGAKDAPYLMDVLQEGADMDSADWWVRDGLLHPARRKVAGSSDLTIKYHHLATAWPDKLHDPQDIYCNILIAEYAGPLYSEPSGNDDPVRIPYQSTIGDDDEISARGEIQRKVSRQYWYKNLFTDWTQQTGPLGSVQTRHIETWSVCQQEQLDMLAQPQVWYEVALVENCAWIQQGDTVDFGITGVTTRLGQVRQVRKRRAPSGDGPLKPIVTTIRSWHINFPT